MGLSESEVYGIIAPHPPIMLEAVGGKDSALTAQTSSALHFAAKTLTRFDPGVIVVLSPHAPTIAGAISVDSSPEHFGSLREFGASTISISLKGSPSFVQELLYRLDERGIPSIDRVAVPSLHAGTLDHGITVPMSILDPASRWPIVPISTSTLALEAYLDLGGELREVAAFLNTRLAVVGSGDCSHRLTPEAPAGYSVRAADFDTAMISLISGNDYFGLSNLDPVLVDKAGQCGLRSFIATGAATAPACTRVLSYERPWGVGYLTAVINEHLAPLENTADSYPRAVFADPVSLARGVIRHFLLTGEMLEPEFHDADGLPGRAGVFVSLHKGEQLRGCIGSIYPTCDSVANEIAKNAVRAATADSRFLPVTVDELDALTIKVDLIKQPEQCDFSDLDPHKWGVIVSSGTKRGLLLPGLSNVSTPEQQLSIAREKAGLDPDEPCVLERFSVVRYT